MPHNIDHLIVHGKSISGLTPELETRLKAMAPILVPHLPAITDTFYWHLHDSPVTAEFLQSHTERLGHLKDTHLQWLTSLFTHDIDWQFTADMVKVGDAHVMVRLPLEFMVGAMYLINKEMIAVIVGEFGGNKDECVQALRAVNAILGFSLVVMQQSYRLF